MKTKREVASPHLMVVDDETHGAGRFVSRDGGPSSLEDLIRANQPSFRWGALNPTRALRAFLDGLVVTLCPVADVGQPAMRREDFAGTFSQDALRVFELGLSQEEQRASRFDEKASAMLSMAGIVVPLIVGAITISNDFDRALLLTLIAAAGFAVLSGLAAFRAMQTRVASRISERAALDARGVIRGDADVRYGLNVLHCMMIEAAINDYRARLVSAAGRFGFLSTLTTCVAGGIVAATRW